MKNKKDLLTLIKKTINDKKIIRQYLHGDINSDELKKNDIKLVMPI